MYINTTRRNSIFTEELSEAKFLVSIITRQKNVPHFYKWRVALWLSGGENISRLDETPLM